MTVNQILKGSTLACKDAFSTTEKVFLGHDGEGPSVCLRECLVCQRAKATYQGNSRYPSLNLKERSRTKRSFLVSSLGIG